jgi:hypothetical protein
MPPEETPAFALSVPLRRAARAEFLVAGFVRSDIDLAFLQAQGKRSILA